MPSPTLKLQALLSSAKAIYIAHTYEQNLRLGLSEAEARNHFLSADDFLPIHIFVVVHAGLRDPLVTKQLLWSMCNPTALQGEGGYYLTVFEAALEYVKAVDMSTGSVEALQESEALDDDRIREARAEAGASGGAGGKSA